MGSKRWNKGSTGENNSKNMLLRRKVVIPVKTGIQNGMFMSYDKHYFVYILASKRNGTLYIGVTNDLIRRAYEHRNDLIEGFTQKYKVHSLAYYEMTNDIKSAIEREKRLKKWNRKWKLELIEKVNPQWKDLYGELV